MSKPTPKSNFLQTALLMITIFLGVQLFFGHKEDPLAAKTADQIFATLVEQNSRLLDIDAAKTFIDYKSKLQDEVGKKQLTKAAAEEKEIHAAILVADAQYKEGLYRDTTTKIRNAYQTLIPYEKRLLDSPSWNKFYPIPAPEISGPATGKDSTPIPNSVTKFDWSSWSGQSLYTKVVTTLTSRNRSDLVYGFIPGYKFIDFLVNLTGANAGFSYWFAAFLLALCVRAIVYPLSQKQLMFSRQMSQLVPLTNEIKQKYKNDQTQQQQKVMELYREYGINPLAGCFPALIQMPLFLTVYQCMLTYQFAFQKGVFLWINPVTSKASHGFLAPNLGQQDYVLIMIYGITMIMATLLTPVTDPTQMKSQRLMGVGISIVFTVFMFTGALPVVAGFVLYWTFTNILASAQSFRAYRMPMPALVKLNAQGGGVLPKPTSKWQQMMDKMMDEQKKYADKNGAATPTDDKAISNGSPKSTPIISSGPTKTGTPAKHKPKKRK